MYQTFISPTYISNLRRVNFTDIQTHIKCTVLHIIIIIYILLLIILNSIFNYKNFQKNIMFQNIIELIVVLQYPKIILKKKFRLSYYYKACT